MRSVILRTVKIWIFALFLVVLVPLMVAADSDLLTFQGGIGVDPESGTNVVCGVNPGTGPWTIRVLKADVDTDGHITVKGRGLLLSGSNVIGSNGGQVVRRRHSGNERVAAPI